MNDRGCIDVWDVDTFDSELLEVLSDAEELVRNYSLPSHQQYLEREASDHTNPYPHNPFSEGYCDLKDALAAMMEGRQIRAWHYTRLADAEVATIKREGISPSCLERLSQRLEGQVAAGALTPVQAAALFAASPFHSDQSESRSDKFWAVSHPLAIDDGGVELLLESWGGEVTYFWQRDPELQDLLKAIGRPRVIELKVPLAATPNGFSAGNAITLTFARSLGCYADSGIFDLYSSRPLRPDAVLAVHSEGDATFVDVGTSYPANFRKVKV